MKKKTNNFKENHCHKKCNNFFFESEANGGKNCNLLTNDTPHAVGAFMPVAHKTIERTIQNKVENVQRISKIVIVERSMT